MKRSRRILLNTVSNAVLQCAGGGVSFVLMPLLLRYFGKEIFGVNAYIAGMALLFTFVSSSISMSLMRFVPDCLARQDFDAFHRFVAAAVLVSLCACVIVGVLFLTFPFYGMALFDIPEHLYSLTRRVFFVIGVAIILRFPMPVINGIYFGTEKFVVLNCIQMVSVLATIVAYLYVKATHGSLVQYTVCVQGGAVLSMLLSLLCLQPILPCRLKWKMPLLSTLRQTFAFNMYLISNQAADTLLYSVDKMILQKLMGAVAVADYHVARRTHALMQRVISLPLSAIIPSLSRAYASDDAGYIRMMNRVGSLLYGALLAPPLIVLFCMYDTFIALWVGDGFSRTVLAGRLFVLTIVAAVPLKVFSHCLVANGRVKALGVAKVSYALLNVPLSILLALRLGFIGVVIPSVAYWLMVHPVLIIVLAARQRMAKNILMNMALVAFLLPCAWLFAGIIPPYYSGTWLGFVLQGAILYGVVLCFYSGLASLFCLRDLRHVWYHVAWKGGRA